MDSRQQYLQQARQAAAAEQEEEDRVRLKSGAGSAVKVFEPNGSEHDKILEYGAQLNDIALQLQEWVSIYQSQGSNGGHPLFSINSKAANADGKKRRGVQQLTYANDGGQIGIQTAFGTRDMGTLRSSRSVGSQRQSARSARMRGSPNRGGGRRSGSRSKSQSRSRSASRSKSREGRNFIQKIEKLRRNLEVEGRAI